MSSKHVRDTIKAELAARWATTPILEIENELVDPPNTEPLQAWVALQFITPADERIMSKGSVGNRVFREDGQIFLHSVAPVGGGSDEALANAEALRDIFRGQEFSGVNCMTVSPPDSGPGVSLKDVSGNWWSAAVVIDYYYDYFG